MSGPIPLEIFGDDPSLVEDAPADIAPSNKTYKKGDLVWYKQRDGAVVSAKVCSVDASVQPPSYGIELGDHFRETEATRLAPRGSGATSSSQPATSGPSKQSALSQPAVQPAPSSPVKQSAPSQPGNAATSPRAAATHQINANGHRAAAKQAAAQPQTHDLMPSSPSQSQQSQQSHAQPDAVPHSPFHASQRQSKAAGASPEGSPRGSPKGHHRAGDRSASSQQSHLQPHQQPHHQPHHHHHHQQRPHHQPSHALQQAHHHQSSPRSHNQSHPRSHHQPQHQTQQHAPAQQDRSGAANYYFNPYMAQMTPEQQRQYLRQYMVAANPSMQGLTAQQQDAYLQQYMHAMQGYQSQQQQQQQQQQVKLPAVVTPASQQGHQEAKPRLQQQQQQQAQPVTQAVDSFHSANQTAMQAKQQQQQPNFGAAAAADDEFGTFEEAATPSAPATVHQPVYDRSAPVPASIFGDDIAEAEDAPLPPLISQPRQAAGPQPTQQASTPPPPQSLPVPFAHAPFEQQAPSALAAVAVHHHPLAPSGLELNGVLGLGAGPPQGSTHTHHAAEADVAEGDDDWGDEWVGSGSPAAAAATPALAEVPRPSPFATASTVQPVQSAVAAARAAGAAAAEADVHAGANGRQKSSDALPAITLGAPLPTPWATRSSSIDAREPSSVRPSSRPPSGTDRKVASRQQPLSLAIFGDEALDQMDAADLQSAAAGTGPKIDTTPWGLNTELRQRASEGGEDEDVEPDREKDEGWVSAGMRKVMGGRRGSLLKRLGSGRLGGVEQDQGDLEAMPQQSSAIRGPSRFRYLAAWTRLMQACAKELERGSFAWQQMCHTGDPQEWMEEESGHAYLAGLGHIYFVVSLLRAAAEHYHADTHSPEFAAASERCDAAWTAKADAEGAFSLQVAVIMALNHPEATRVGGLGLPFEDLITLPSEAAKQLPLSDPGAIHRHARETGQKLCAFSLLPLEGLQEVPHVRWVDGQPCLVPLANLWMNRVSDESLLLH